MVGSTTIPMAVKNKNVSSALNFSVRSSRNTEISYSKLWCLNHKIGQKSAKNYAGIEWDWEKIKSSFAESNGWQVWKAKS